MKYSYPDELEFIEREFGLIETEEGYFSYVYIYPNGDELEFTHTPFHNNSFSARLISESDQIFSIYKERVESIEFQAWGTEKIIRVHCSSPNHPELRIAYLPKPRLYYSEF